VARALIGVAAFAVLGLGAWSGAVLVSRDTETATAPTATMPTQPGTTLETSASAGAPPTTTAPPSQTPPPTTDAPAPPPAPPPVDSGVEAFEQQVVTLVNAQRASAGCSALTVDDRLVTAARGHSADMAQRNYFDHTTPDGVTSTSGSTPPDIHGRTWPRTSPLVNATRMPS
jgi:uncharacterized protein YkwD